MSLKLIPEKKQNQERISKILGIQQGRLEYLSSGMSDKIEEAIIGEKTTNYHKFFIDFYNLSDEEKNSLTEKRIPILKTISLRPIGFSIQNNPIPNYVKEISKDKDSKLIALDYNQHKTLLIKLFYNSL